MNRFCFIGLLVQVFAIPTYAAEFLPVAVFGEDSREASPYRATGKITCYFRYENNGRLREDVFAGTGNFIFSDQLADTSEDIVTSAAHVFEHPDIGFIDPYRCTLTNYYANEAILITELDIGNLVKGPYESTREDKDDWAVIRVTGEPYGFEGVSLSSIFGSYRYMNLNRDALDLFFEMGASAAVVAYNRHTDTVSISRDGELYVPEPGDVLFGSEGVWGSSHDVSRTGSGGAIILEYNGQAIFVGHFKGSRHNLATYSEYPGDGSPHSRRDSTNIVVRSNPEFTAAIRALSGGVVSTTED